MQFKRLPKLDEDRIFPVHANRSINHAGAIMFPSFLRDELINSLSDETSSRHCTLCGTHLTAYLDEVPCPHWFITTGHRAFNERHLRSIFDVYRVPFVIEYLKLVCIYDRVGQREVTATSSGWSLGWRGRRWIFEELKGRSAGFQLSLFNEGRNACSLTIAEQAD